MPGIVVFVIFLVIAIPVCAAYLRREGRKSARSRHPSNRDEMRE